MLQIYSILRDSSAPAAMQEFDTPPTDFALSPDMHYWLDFSSMGEAEVLMLREVFHFHKLAIEDCAEHVHFPKLDDYGEYLYMVLHAVDETADQVIGTMEVDVFLGENFLLTYHEKPVSEIVGVKAELVQKGFLLARGPDFLLQVVLDKLVTSYFPRLEEFESRIDQVEEDVLKAHVKSRSPEQLLDLKHELIQLKRVVFPQRELLLKLSRPEFPRLIDQQTLMYFRDTYDELYRIGEMMDGHREMLSSIFEAHYAVASYRMNDIMRVLTIFTTILMPMSVLTGLYGMNFEWMPMLRSPFGFAMVMAAMLAIAIGMLVFFRRKKWL